MDGCRPIIYRYFVYYKLDREVETLFNEFWLHTCIGYNPVAFRVSFWTNVELYTTDLGTVVSKIPFSYCSFTWIGFI